MKVESKGLGCYTGLMPKPKRSALGGAMVAEATKEELEGIAEREDRSLSYVASALLMRGLRCYQKDGKLAVDSNGAEAENESSGTAEKRKLSTFEDVDRARARKKPEPVRRRKP